MSNITEYFKDFKKWFGDNDEANIYEIIKFLDDSKIPFTTEEYSTERVCGDGSSISLYEPIFLLKDGTLQLRYVNSEMHKLDYSKRFGEVQRGIGKGYFGSISKMNRDSGVRTIWIKDYEITESFLIEDVDTMEPIHGYRRKWEVIKNYISSACGIIDKRFYARDCEVKLVPSCAPNNVAKRFLEQFCFYGNRNATVTLGLYLKKDKNGLKAGTLLMLDSFGHNFYGNKGKEDNPNVEVIRVATRIGIQVIGGSSKLLKYFLENYPEMTPSTKKESYKVDRVVFYVDADHNDGKSLETLGYDFVGWDVSGFHNYAVNSIDIPKLKVTKGQIFQRKPMIHKTIMEYMGKGDIVSIGTCGTIVYELHRDEYLKKLEDGKTNSK